MTGTDALGSNLSALRDLFGDNRAEWSPDRFRELFVEPSYSRKLESRKPTLIVGGRGTGKTTALRALRFDATLERLESTGRTFGDQEHLGLFIRIDKNRTHAFKGVALPDDIWAKYFAHYFNLLVATEMAQLTEWLAPRAGTNLSIQTLSDICRDLGLEAVTSVSGLRTSLRHAISALQISVNNPSTTSIHTRLSLPTVPIRTFAEALDSDGLSEGRTIFCCIDEYENLLDSQQAIINTYITHAEPPLSYKVGIRKNGLRNRDTIAGSDPLQTPDDFDEVDIASEGFELFAERVASLRLTRAREQGVHVPSSLSDFLVDLSQTEEAELLGASDIASGVLKELEQDKSQFEYFSSIPASDTYFLRYWSDSDGTPITILAQDWRSNERKWRDRINNYRYASLFWLSHGRKGARIRKYYCGSRVFMSLPAGNIRYFLELIDRAIEEQLALDTPANASDFVLSPIAQTKAARWVGWRRIEQIEGLAEHGVELKRLMLGIGKVFFELARSPLGRTPEVTSFVVDGDATSRARLLDLLREGVATLAFVSSPRTKAPLETKDDEYRLHPIYCAFFEISHRRKRGVSFKADVLLRMLDQPREAISDLLADSPQASEDELPEQLAFFTSFFGNGSRR